MTDARALTLGNELLRHPLAQRVLAKYRATGQVRVTTAADVLGERLMGIGSWLIHSVEDPDRIISNTEMAATDLALQLANRGLRATPYLWTEDVRAELGAHMEIPKHIVAPTVLPEPNMWWTFETGIELDGLILCAMVVRDAGQGIEVMTIGESADSLILNGSLWQYGKCFPEDYDDERATELAGILASLAFLNSPYIPKSQSRLARQERRDCLRHQAPIPSDEVTFVTLRRPHTSRSTETADIAESVSWKHQWVVSGHYRSQWYPTEHAHHLIWIAPYMKGPADAPLLEHAYRVAR